uniref:Uncharacterized protein n=1 Tax=Glossina pallidipes TaxID=7398 RepID=A0A1B0AFG1_GLOPL
MITGKGRHQCFSNRKLPWPNKSKRPANVTNSLYIFDNSTILCDECMKYFNSFTTSFLELCLKTAKQIQVRKTFTRLMSCFLMQKFSCVKISQADFCYHISSTFSFILKHVIYHKKMFKDLLGFYALQSLNLFATKFSFLFMRDSNVPKRKNFPSPQSKEVQFCN